MASERSEPAFVATLETKRYVLRPFRDADIGWLAEMYGDPEVIKYLGRGTGSSPPNPTEEEARQRGSMVLEKYRYGPLGLWAVDEKATRETVGWGALKDLDGNPEIEVGYGLLRRFWGRGIATEVARRLLRHGFEDHGLERIVAVTHPENIASRHVLEKLGMRYLGNVNRYYGRETTYFEMVRFEWSP